MNIYSFKLKRLCFNVIFSSCCKILSVNFNFSLSKGNSVRNSRNDFGATRIISNSLYRSCSSWLDLLFKLREVLLGYLWLNVCLVKSDWVLTEHFSEGDFI